MFIRVICGAIKNIYQMDFLQLVASRQSDRAYDMTRPVEAEKLERILEAARLAHRLVMRNRGSLS